MGTGDSFTDRYDLQDVEYDKNGNIQSLLRKGHVNEDATSFGVMDDLNYTYDAGNKLLRVDDAGNTSFGFKQGSNSGDDYAYDANGNMISDANKGITSVTYNHLNLPTEVTFNDSDTQKINYTYSADGIKIRKVVNNNGAVTTLDYACLLYTSPSPRDA